MDFEYNTQKPPLLLMEYGRNVQKIVDFICKVEDKAKRTQMATTLIHLMKQLNPSVKENHDNPQRIWDHLFIMSDFTLDVDAPFPMPDRSILYVKPMKMEYIQTELKFKHYGRNVEILVESASKIQDEQERKMAFLKIGKLMKTFYETWNRDIHNMETIIHDIKVLSKGKVDLLEEFRQNPRLFDMNHQHHHVQQHHHSGSGHSQHGQQGGRSYHYDKKKKKRRK
jgi:hypothetical protein